MSDEPQSSNTLVKVAVAAVLLLVFGGVALVVCLPIAGITGLTVLGNSLEASFEEVANEIDSP